MYADIIVDISHDKLDRTFEYRIPKEMEDKLLEGMRVNVCFGKGDKEITGFVVGIKEKACFDETRIKDINSILEEKLLVEGRIIQTAAFIRRNFGGTMNQALKTVLPVKKSVKAKVTKTIRLLVTSEEYYRILNQYRNLKRLPVAKIRLLEAFVVDEQLLDELSYDLVTGKLNISSSTITALKNDKVIEIIENEYYRNPVKIKDGADKPIELNDSQKYIADTIINDYENDIHKTYLIKGITGSGKTEVYMSVIEKVLESGRQVIMLIPEISLTFQTVMRFYKRFNDQVSIMNSKLSNGERFDQFEKAKNGICNIMIGPRSALFTPFKDIGLIVIDEEHETTYKNDSVPKYDAIEVAKEIARQCNASLILGSATPSINSYYKAVSGEYTLFNLNERAGNAILPNVNIVDLKEELKAGNKSIFSRKLKELMRDRLNKKQQIMLFINRRGYFGFISCRSCGHVLKCPHCDISLTSHKDGRLVCHYCGYTTKMVSACPKCNSKYISALRGGTQMVEEAIAKEFPDAKVLRMDMDTTSTKDGHEKILSAFMANEADILVGTQMIVKGHDFPNVTLMGILAADISLHASDYRSAERTFDLLTQAAGRAGRGSEKGEVVIQAYDTEHFAITTASKQDYEEFYNQEIMFRTLLDYPPVTNMMMVRLLSKYENRLETAANLIKIKKENVKVIGPCNAPLYKADDIYNKVIYYKTEDYSVLTQIKDEIEAFVKDNNDFKYVSVQFDFNPL